MDKVNSAEVLRLRAISAVSRDESVRRCAQDDDFVLKSRTSRARSIKSQALGMTVLFRVEDFTRKIYKVTGSERSRGIYSSANLSWKCFSNRRLRDLFQVTVIAKPLNVCPDIQLAGHPLGAAARLPPLHLCVEKRPAYSAQPASAAVLSPTLLNVSVPAVISPGPFDDS
jgi:hypothetical protein